MSYFKNLKIQFFLLLFLSPFLFHCGSTSGNSTNNPPPINPFSGIGDHPRLLLSQERLEGLRKKVIEKNSDWIALKNKCDGLLEDSKTKPATIPTWDEPHSLYSLGLCYQVLLSIDSQQANLYGELGKKFLEYLSNNQNFLRDKGYDIRYYGVGMAIGYDWLHPILSSDLKSKVYTSLNRWIAAFPDGWEWNQENPQGNYYAGYYAAKGLAALSTFGDNPQADQLWDEFYEKDHLNKVQPYYSKYLAGGGWPEGWNYGPLATFNMILPIVAAKTASNVDLIHDRNHPFFFPIDQAKNLMHFSWPNFLTMDDRGTQFSGDNPSANPVFLLTFLSSVLTDWKDEFAPYFHSYVRAVRSTNSAKVVPWQNFLFWDETAPEKDYKTLPASYFASGMNAVAIRSSWGKEAVWGSFTSGQYVNNPWSGEQYYDQGSLVIRRGETAFLVNAVGALLRNSPGVIPPDGNPSIQVNGRGYSLEEAIYDNLYQSPVKRDLFNIFYVSSPSTGQVATPLDLSQTHISRFEDQGDYVAITGTQLEDMYVKDESQNRSIRHWTREMNYLRSDNLFIVFDRTEIADSSLNQWISFHFAADNETTSLTNGSRHYSLTKNGTLIGQAITVFPENSQESFENLFGNFGIRKVARLNISPSDRASTQVWLTVFNPDSNANNFFTASRLTSNNGGVIQGNFSAVFLENSQKRIVSVFSNDQSEQPSSSSLELIVPTVRSFALIVNDLLPNTNYQVEVVSRQNNSTRLKLVPQLGSSKTSSTGVLFLNL